ncbi:MAG: pyruvate ferredoxin oxidoreductase, partial [Gammaproteobacteria bacterium]|nr:pyruvate ferredoxin oxidoreductase [Gammaproteobacteria bacterium]
KYNPEKHEKEFTYFDWREFGEEEFLLCPPVVAVGGDGAMYDIGFQNLSRMLMSGMPIKAFVVDTQVYSNTGGQACTSGFIGQVADMTPFGPAMKGKEEIRKEMSLIGMAHRTSYVLQGSISNTTHLLEGYIEGLNSRRPALFNIYAVCQPEHGVADDVSDKQSKLAVESRAYPLMRYDPDAGTTWEECLDMEGNPAMEEDWPVYNLAYKDEEGKEASMELPMTFVDFAFTEARFRKQFRKLSPDIPEDQLVSVAEFIDMDADDRQDVFPYIWAVDKKERLMQVQVSEELITSAEERRDLWRLLKSLAGADKICDPDIIADQVRADMVQKLSAGIMAMVGGGSGLPAPAAMPAGTTQALPQAPAPADFEPVWIDTPDCTACDECVEINPKIFAYNDKKLAEVVDPRGGSFKDIVKAAEKCTAMVIHPGVPANPKEKGLDKLIKRAEKYQ